MSLLSSLLSRTLLSSLFFFNDTATTEIYTLSLHDALPILAERGAHAFLERLTLRDLGPAIEAHHARPNGRPHVDRSEEHTSELQSHVNLVCRLLLEKKKINHKQHHQYNTRP